jgi:hypothetical protein
MKKKSQYKSDSQKKIEKRKKKSSKVVSQSDSIQNSNIENQDKTDSNKKQEKKLDKIIDSDQSQHKNESTKKQEQVDKQSYPTSTKSYASVVTSGPADNNSRSHNATSLSKITVTFHVYVPPFVFDFNSEKCEFGVYGEFNNWNPSQMKKLNIVRKFKEGLILSNTFELELPSYSAGMEYKYLLKYKNSENETDYLVEYLGRQFLNRRLALNNKSIHNNNFKSIPKTLFLTIRFF